MPAEWLALLPVLFAVWEGLTAKSCRVAGTILRAPPRADRGAARRLAAPARQPAALPGAAGAPVLLLGTSSGFITGLAIGWSQRIGYWVHPVLRLLGPVPSTRAAAAVPVYFSLELRRQRVLIALSTSSRSRC